LSDLPGSRPFFRSRQRRSSAWVEAGAFDCAGDFVEAGRRSAMGETRVALTLATFILRKAFQPCWAASARGCSVAHRTRRRIDRRVFNSAQKRISLWGYFVRSLPVSGHAILCSADAPGFTGVHTGRHGRRGHSLPNPATAPHLPIIRQHPARIILRDSGAGPVVDERGMESEMLEPPDTNLRTGVAACAKPWRRGAPQAGSSVGFLTAPFSGQSVLCCSEISNYFDCKARLSQ
jgi:hypothetical protein